MASKSVVHALYCVLLNLQRQKVSCTRSPCFSRSKQGYEVLYAGNYLGHFYLIQLLLGLLKSSHGRVVATSSLAHWGHDLNLDSLLPAANRGRADERLWFPEKMVQYANTKFLQVTSARAHSHSSN